ncbi:MAG TPA: hypothetical protein VNN73_11035 [Blastocatellia bacterium]|nr:hypothetical protein [Blastocatellia bacterium]
MGDLIRDVLDKQLVDRNQNSIGKVDGIIVALREGKPPRVAYIEVGTVALARRLNPRLAKWAAALERRLKVSEGEPYRIPWSKVREVGIDVEVDLEWEKTPLISWEKWVNEKIIGRIPGA